MIKQRFIVERRYWKVYVYYDITERNSDEILDKIKELNLPENYVKSAYTMLKYSKPNRGITFSNTKIRESIIVIGKTSNASQFVNSFVHEISHLTNHIARTYHLDINSEEVCYISGDIAQEMFKRCHALMCDCCRDT